MSPEQIDIRKITAELTGCRVEHDVLMQERTSLHIGGPVDAVIVPDNLESLLGALERLGQNGVPVYPLGGGTNLLVKDGGIKGAVISLQNWADLEEQNEGGDSVQLEVGAGIRLQRLVRHARDHGLAGLEGLIAIPGQLGGAVAGNAGAYGCEIGNTVVRITAADQRGNLMTLGTEDLKFGYRSITLPEGALVISLLLNLRKDDAASVAERTEGYLKHKSATQPVGSKSAGCVFKNPLGAIAGRLIDEAGCKGLRVNDIEVSAMHANFFVNLGAGTAGDFLQLMDTVAERVRGAFGIVLEPEIKVVGR